MNGESIETSVLTFVLILVRITSFFGVLPFFGRRAIPNLILIGLSLALTYLQFASLESLPQVLLDYRVAYLTWFGFAIAAAGEFLIGALLGLGFGMFVYPIQVAGGYLAQELGLNLASMTDASTQANSDVMASLLQTIALLLFFVLNFHHFIVFVISRSFSFIPLGHALDLRSIWPSVSEQFTHVEATGLSLVAPVGICLFVVLIILILLTKAAPSMNIFSIGLSIRVGAGLFFVFLFLPQMLEAIQHYLENVQEWIIEYMASFSPS